MSVRRPVRAASSHAPRRTTGVRVRKIFATCRITNRPKFTGIGPSTPLHRRSHSATHRQRVADGLRQSFQVGIESGSKPQHGVMVGAMRFDLSTPGRGVCLVGYALTSRQLIFAARARSRTPGHQLVATNHPGVRIPCDLSQQHPCKQRHSTPEGGMCKKRLHVVTPGCPCATVEPILLVFTPRAHSFRVGNAKFQRENSP